MPRITELPAATALTDDDLLVVVDAPGGSAGTRKITALDAKTYLGGAGGGGSTILTGADYPSGSDGDPGDFWIDTATEFIFGPKQGDEAYGAEQKIILAGTFTNISSAEYGIRMNFAQAGRVAKLRYYRMAGTSSPITFNIWNQSGTKVLGPLTDSTPGVGWHDVTLPTPVYAALGGGTLVFSAADAVAVATSPTFTDTADCAVSGGYWASVGSFPNSTLTSLPLIEPTFEPGYPWPTAQSIYGLPSGGITSQVLSKSSDDDYSVMWADPAGSGGMAMLTGAGVPSGATGADGDFYVDTTGDDLYGPKSGSGFGTEQRITIIGLPDANIGSYAAGPRITFTRAGRITKLRYYRLTGAGATIDLQIWNSGGSQAITAIPRTDAGTGWFEATLGTPLSVAAGSTYTFAQSGTISRHTSDQTVTNTGDCTFVAHYYAAAGFYPNSAGVFGTVYIEPVYEPAVEVWPLALETTTGGGMAMLTGTGAPAGGLGNAGDIYVDTDADDLYGPKSATGFGAEQRITVGSDPNDDTSTNNYGCRVTFTRAGRVTKLRYKRRSGSVATLNFRCWTSGGTQAGSTVSASDVGTGAFEVALAAPLAVAAGSTYTFAVGSPSLVPRNGSSAQAVTNTTDCTFVGYYSSNINESTFPNTAQATASAYVEPVYEPDIGAWPLALETPAPARPGTLVEHATPTGTTETLDLAAGDVHRVRWDANVTLSLANVPAGLARFYLLLYHENTSTSYTVTWWSGIEWADDAAGPMLPSATANAEAFIEFWTFNGGTAWRALQRANFYP